MSIPAQHECKHLVDLPQEILDMIFDLAYPRAGRLVTRPEWEFEERKSHQDEPTYSKRPFPSPKVNEFFVSKTFLDCATKAWIQNLEPVNTLHLSDQMLQNPETGAQSILFKHLKSLRTDSSDLICSRMIYDLPSLKEVELMIEIEDLESSSSATAWETLLSDSDLRDTEAYRVVVGRKDGVGNKGLRGLTRFRAIPDDCDSDTLCEPYKTIFDNNIAKFEALVKPIVTQPRPPPNVHTKKKLRNPTKSTNATVPRRSLRTDQIPEDLKQLQALAREEPHKFEAWMKKARAAKQKIEAVDRLLKGPDDDE